MPTFAEMAQRYLDEGMGHLAPSTQEDRSGLLRPDASIVSHFGDERIDAIRRGDLLTYWLREIEGKGRKRATGQNRLDAISGVLGFAVDLELIELNPVDAVRATLRRASGRRADVRRRSPPSGRSKTRRRSTSCSKRRPGSATRGTS